MLAGIHVVGKGSWKIEKLEIMKMESSSRSWGIFDNFILHAKLSIFDWYLPTWMETYQLLSLPNCPFQLHVSLLTATCKVMLTSQCGDKILMLVTFFKFGYWRLFKTITDLGDKKFSKFFSEFFFWNFRNFFRIFLNSLFSL